LLRKLRRLFLIRGEVNDIGLIYLLILAARAVVIAHGRPLPPPALWGTAPVTTEGEERE
jgi:hypothetical protein